MSDDKGGSLWSRIRKPASWSILAVGVAAGIILWGGFNTAMEATNTMTFCISCH
jgi:cytochrome c-type protein NapC